MEPENRLIKERISKLKEIRNWEVNPYPYTFDKKDSTTKIKKENGSLANEAYGENEYSIAGRVMTVRNMGKAAFFNLQDEEGTIQVYIRKDDVGDAYKIFKKTDMGDFVGIKGECFKTKTGELSIRAKEFTL